jgi:hypothetical protein
MKSIKISTNDFETYNKINNLNLYNSVEFENNPLNRKRLSVIIKNINKFDNFIESFSNKNKIILNKKTNIKLNVYFSKKK